MSFGATYFGPSQTSAGAPFAGSWPTVPSLSAFAQPFASQVNYGGPTQAQQVMAQAALRAASAGLTLPNLRAACADPSTTVATDPAAQQLLLAALFNQTSSDGSGAIFHGGIQPGVPSAEQMLHSQMQLLALQAGSFAAAPVAQNPLALLLAAQASHANSAPMPSCSWPPQQLPLPPVSLPLLQQPALMQETFSTAQEPAVISKPPHVHAAVDAGIVEASPSISANSSEGMLSQLRDTKQQHQGAPQRQCCGVDSYHGFAAPVDSVVQKIPAKTDAANTACAQQTRPPDMAACTDPAARASSVVNAASMPPPHRRLPMASDTQAYVHALLGPQQWASVRSTLLKQQQTFVKQLFELHKLSQVQSLQCAELDVDPSCPASINASCPASKTAMTMAGAVTPSDHARGRFPALTAQRGGVSGHPVGGSVWRVVSGSNGMTPLPSAGTTSQDRSDIATLSALQRVHEDLPRLLNIPAPLRAKACCTSLGPGTLRSPGQAAAAPTPPLTPTSRPGLLKPQPHWAGSCAAPVDINASHQSASVGQPTTTSASAQPSVLAPQPTAAVSDTPPPPPARTMLDAAAAALIQQPGSLGMLPALGALLNTASQPPPPHDNILQAAAALLHSSCTLPPSILQAGSLPSLAALGLGTLQSISSAQGKQSDGLTLAGTATDAQGGLPSAPTPNLPSFHPGLMPFPVPSLASTGLLPGMTLTNAVPTIPSSHVADLHAAWFARHYGAPPPQQPQPPQLENVAALHGAAPAPHGVEVAPGKWWQDETATFGDVLPSALPAASLCGGTGQVGNRRPVTQDQNGSHKKARYEDNASPILQNCIGFKAFRPKKARSQRGSNRLGSHRTATNVSSDSDLSNGSQNREGSHVAGSVVSAAYARAKSYGVDAHGARDLTTSQQYSMAAEGDIGIMGERTGGRSMVVAPPILTGGVGESANILMGGGSGGGEDKSAAGILLSLSAGVPSGLAGGPRSPRCAAPRRGLVTS